jgi:hypothetical protein
MENNKKESELANLLKEKKYEEAVDLVLGKEGSENDISGTPKFGVLSSIGRDELLKLFTEGNFYGYSRQGKLSQHSDLFNLVQDMVINEKIASGAIKGNKDGDYLGPTSTAAKTRVLPFIIAEDIVTNHPGSKIPKLNLKNPPTEKDIAEIIAKLRESPSNNDKSNKPK